MGYVKHDVNIFWLLRVKRELRQVRFQKYLSLPSHEKFSVFNVNRSVAVCLWVSVQGVVVKAKRYVQFWDVWDNIILPKTK